MPMELTEQLPEDMIAVGPRQTLTAPQETRWVFGYYILSSSLHLKDYTIFHKGPVYLGSYQVWGRRGHELIMKWQG